MLFNSAQFLLFFPLAALGYYVIPHKLRYLWLLVCSYYFYMCWNPAYALLLAFSTAVTWLSGLVIGHFKKQDIRNSRSAPAMKLTVAVSFLLNLGVLAYFKYANFFTDNVSMLLARLGVAWQAPAVDVLLPVGISFYTFQALSYTMDVYRGDIAPEKNPLRYALFVSFFPQLVAGPIERSKNLLTQLREFHPFRFENLREGFMLMLWGYFLKLMVADRIAVFVDAVYSAFPACYGWVLILASALFCVQIYCDFAGYSTIAMGAARVMGFSLTDNFNAPYLSRSVAEFWRRWHISLSGWFRDYLYIPLGGSRRGKARKYLNILIVFMVSGLWHGAQWTFVVWGLLNGLYQVAGDITLPARRRLCAAMHIDRDALGHRLLQTIITFVLVDIAFIFFRAESLSQALAFLRGMTHVGNLWVFFDQSLYTFGLSARQFSVLLVSLLVLFAADFTKRRGVCIRDVICRQALWFRWLVLLAGVMAVLIFGIWGSGYDAAAFIYFQF